MLKPLNTLQSIAGDKLKHTLTQSRLVPQIVSTQSSDTQARKKQSAFEKLWARAKKLKAQNVKLSADLEKTIARLRETVLPQELAAITAQKPLVIKLLQMGQRKSLTQWQRQELDEWIRESIEDFHQHNLIDTELLNHLAHYDAFRMGVSLDDENTEPHKQFAEIVQQAEKDRQEQLRQEAEATAERINDFREELKTQSHEDIEAELDSILGPRPEVTDHTTSDLFEDDLIDQQRQHQQQYDEERAILRKKIIDDLLCEIDQITGHGPNPEEESPEDPFSDSFQNDPFSMDDEDFGSQNKNDPELTNNTFQRLFRATAAKLHPDREPDADTRLKKQSLMATLLKARKSGDLLTILELYENWVGEHAGFSKTDEKSLKQTLQKWIITLEEEQEDIIMQSPLHFQAYNRYHNKSQEKISREISQRVKELQRSEKLAEEMNSQITSLKSLKPFLEERYETKYSYRGYFR